MKPTVLNLGLARPLDLAISNGLVVKQNRPEIVLLAFGFSYRPQVRQRPIPSFVY